MRGPQRDHVVVVTQEVDLKMSGQAAAPPVAVVTREDDATGTARGGAPGLCGVIAQMRGRTVPQLVQRLSTTALSIRRNPIRHLQKMQSTIHHLERAARQCVANALPNHSRGHYGESPPACSRGHSQPGRLASARSPVASSLVCTRGPFAWDQQPPVVLAARTFLCELKSA